MSDINLSKAVRSNLLSLQNTATMMAKTQERLATGLKVNSALDNPTNFFTASALKSRAGDLGQLMDSVGNAVQTIAAADKGIKALTDLVKNAQAIARQALQATAAATDGPDTPAPATTAVATGSVTATSEATLTGTVDLSAFDMSTLDGEDLSVTIGDRTVVFSFADDVADATSGAVHINTDQASADVRTAFIAALNHATTGFGAGTAAMDGNNLELTADADISIASGAAATAVFGTATSADATNTLSAALAGDLEFSIGDTDFTVDVDGLDDLDAIVTAINDEIGSAGTASIHNGALRITAANAGEDISFEAGANVTALGLTDAAAPAAGGGDDDGETPAAGETSKRAQLLEQYNDILGQIDDLVRDTHFNGVNLLGGDDLQVIFNEDGTSKLDISGVTFNAAGLGLAEEAAGTFDTNAGINGVLDKLKAGIETLRTQASTFGSNLSVVETRQNFTKDMINVLETGSANLTLADTNEEAANLLALQTRQQLSSTALSMASQADQAVLRLF